MTPSRVRWLNPPTLDELRRILFDEVHPAVRGNLMVSAGVWSGFDADWLCARIAERRQRPRWLRLPSVILAAAARASWAELESRIVRLRAFSGQTLRPRERNWNHETLDKT